MRPIVAFVAVVVSFTSGLAFGADDLKLLAGKQPPDARLGLLRDYNTVTDWTPHYADSAAWEKRAKEVREQVLVSNGLWPMPEKTPLNAVIHGKIDREDYTIEKVYFASLPGHYVTGNLYRPKNKTGKLPVMLYAHGHWENGRMQETADGDAKEMVQSGAEKTPEGAKYFMQAACAGLARLGCVVFQYDMVGYADSRVIEHRKGFTDVEAQLRLQSFMGLQTWNSIRSLDFVLSLPDVDSQRVGITGASGGGTQSMILAAIDPRLTLSFPAVMVSMDMQGGCVCENASLLRVGLNNVELAATFAPKPQGMTGANDWTKAIETKGLPQLKEIYGLYNAADNVGAWHRPFPHNYNQVSRELLYSWVNKHFKLGAPDPVAERPFTPVPLKELSVWDAAHPQPADAVGADGVRAYMTQASEKQLNALIGADPNEYRRHISTALRVMVNDKWPASSAVVEGSKKEKQAEGYTLETGLLTRAGEGTALPYAYLVPADWNGETVIWEHPAGKMTLVDEAGKPLAPVQRILAAKYAVLCGDLFGTGEFVVDEKAAIRPVDAKFAGFTLGYNRSLLGERVHDILTLVSYAKAKNSKFVHQVAWEGAGLWALLAKGLAGEAILRSAIDLNGFDFDTVKDTGDENLLPGALKYGGVMSFVTLCRVGETALYRKPENKEPPLPSRGVREGKGRMVDWVIREGGLDYDEVPRR